MRCLLRFVKSTSVCMVSRRVFALPSLYTRCTSHLQHTLAHYMIIIMTRTAPSRSSSCAVSPSFEWLTRPLLPPSFSLIIFPEGLKERLRRSNRLYRDRQRMPIRAYSHTSPLMHRIERKVYAHCIKEQGKGEGESTRRGQRGMNHQRMPSPFESTHFKRLHRVFWVTWVESE